MTAKSTNPNKSDISGISIYKNGDYVIAIVPGHGRLVLSYQKVTLGPSFSAYYWTFQANNALYYLANLPSKL